MKTIVMIFTPFGLENNIPEIKSRIATYLGSRLIKENEENLPMMVLNDYLDPVDKKRVAEIAESVLDKSALILIETNDESFGKDGNLLVVNPV